MGKALIGTLLVLLGVVLLLTNFGYLSWEVLEELGRLWPLLLVAWGISLIIKGTKLAFLGFLGPLLLVAALFYVLWGYYHGSGAETRSVTLVQELTDIDEARVSLKFAGGRLDVRAAETMSLVHAELEYGAGSSSPRLDYYEDDGLGHASLRHRGRQSSGPGLGNRWEVGLTDQVPLEIRLTAEGASCRLDLEGLQIVDLDVSAAASSVGIRVGEGDMDGLVRIDAGVSKVRLEIPRHYGIRLLLSCGLCWKNLPDGMSKRSAGGRAYYSKNYGRAPYTMDVEVEAGLSRVIIEQY